VFDTFSLINIKQCLADVMKQPHHSHRYLRKWCGGQTALQLPNIECANSVDGMDLSASTNIGQRIDVVSVLLGWPDEGDGCVVGRYFLNLSILYTNGNAIADTSDSRTHTVNRIVNTT